MNERTVVAIETGSGDVLWVTSSFVGSTSAAVDEMALSADGSRLVGIGHHWQVSDPGVRSFAFAIDTGTGEKLWYRNAVSRGPTDVVPVDVGIGPSGDVFASFWIVTLPCDGDGDNCTERAWPDFLTASFDGETGGRRWIDRYGGTRDDRVSGLVVLDDVVVTCGSTPAAGGHRDVTCLGYVP